MDLTFDKDKHPVAALGNFYKLFSPEHNINVYTKNAPRGSIMVLNYNYVDDDTSRVWGKDSWIDLLYTQSEEGGCDQYLETKDLSYDEAKEFKKLRKNGLKLELLDKCD